MLSEETLRIKNIFLKKYLNIFYHPVLKPRRFIVRTLFTLNIEKKSVMELTFAKDRI